MLKAFTRGAAICLMLALPAAPMGQTLPAPDEPGIVTIAPAIERVTGAVVNVSIVAERSMEANPLFRDPLFRRFFDLPEKVTQQPRMSAGTGVIVDGKKGHVGTNHHVIENGDRVTVTFKGHRRLDTEVIGGDPGADIAVLQIAPEDLADIPCGYSEALKVGDLVVAIGNPFGLGQTVTSGIISALGRSGIDPQGYEDFIQTDASINPGNYGGASITLDGRLIGISTAIVLPSRGNLGNGFAVPIDMARVAMDQLVEFGEVRRCILGVAITSIAPGSQAERAGLRPGDVVMAVIDRPVHSVPELLDALDSDAKVIVLGLYRSGAQFLLVVPN